MLCRKLVVAVGGIQSSSSGRKPFMAGALSEVWRLDRELMLLEADFFPFDVLRLSDLLPFVIRRVDLRGFVEPVGGIQSKSSLRLPFIVFGKYMKCSFKRIRLKCRPLFGSQFDFDHKNLLLPNHNNNSID